MAASISHPIRHRKRPHGQAPGRMPRESELDHPRRETCVAAGHGRRPRRPHPHSRPTRAPSRSCSAAYARRPRRSAELEADIFAWGRAWLWHVVGPRDRPTGTPLSASRACWSAWMGAASRCGSHCCRSARAAAYASEAAAAVLRFAHERAGLARVVAVARLANIGSRTVLGAIGMREVEHFVRDGEEMVMFASEAAWLRPELRSRRMPLSHRPRLRCSGWLAWRRIASIRAWHDCCCCGTERPSSRRVGSGAGWCPRRSRR